MSSKKYKILSSIGNFNKFKDILSKSIFLGFFQLKSLKLENSILIKKLILGSDLKIVVCKNVLMKKSNLFPNSLLTLVPQGSIIILYSFLNFPNSTILNGLINKIGLLPLIFRINNKFTFLKKSYFLLDKQKNDICIELLQLLYNQVKVINNFFIFLNTRLQISINF